MDDIINRIEKMKEYKKKLISEATKNNDFSSPEYKDEIYDINEAIYYLMKEGNKNK